MERTRIDPFAVYHWPVLICLLVVSCVPFGVRLDQALHHTKADFYDFYRAGALVRLGHGELIYRTTETAAVKLVGEPRAPNGHYVYPPPFALFVLPLTCLSFHDASVAWFVMQLLLTLLGTWLLWASLNYSNPRARWRTAACLGIVLLNLSPLYMELCYGNSNAFLFCTLAGVLYLAVRNRSIEAGLLLSLAFAVKLTPGILILCFLFRGNWRAIGGFAAGTLVWLGVSICESGLSCFSDVYRILSDFSHVGPYLLNQSLNAFLLRLTTSTDVHLAPFLGAFPVEIVYRLIALGVLALTCAVAWLRRENLVFGFGVFVAATCIASPVTWAAHMVVLLLPMAWLLVRLGSGYSTRSPGRTIGILLGAVPVAVFLLSDFGIALVPVVKGLGPVLAMSGSFYGAVSVWLIMVALGFHDSLVDQRRLAVALRDPVHSGYSRAPASPALIR